MRGSPCRRMPSNARRHGSTRTVASIETSAFISSSEADELSLQLLFKLQLPATETETEIVLVTFHARATLDRTVTMSFNSIKL